MGDRPIRAAGDRIAGARQGKIEGGDLAVATILFLAGLCTRLPFANRMLYDSDAVRFALAVEDFDVTRMRPHAPGYILYVALAKGADRIIGDPRVSLVVVSMAAGALTLAVLYLLTKRIYGRGRAAAAALLLGTSPLYWFNTEMPYTYALEGLLATLFAAACYEGIRGDPRGWMASAALLGLAAGVRQHLPIMLAPLWAYALREASWRERLRCLLIFGLVCLAWFLPMVALSGGLGKYLLAVRAQFRTWVLHPSPWIWQVKTRMGILGGFLGYALGAGWIFLGYAGLRRIRGPVKVRDKGILLAGFWVLPAAAFFLAVNVYNSGHILLILPPLCMLLAQAVHGFSRDLASFAGSSLAGRGGVTGRWERAVFAASVLLLMLGHLWIFLGGRTPVSYAAMAEAEQGLSERVRLTREHFPPAETLILTCRMNTQAGYYLPDYLVCCPFPVIFSERDVPLEAQNVYLSRHHRTEPGSYWIPTGFEIEPIPLPRGVRRVVLWTDEMAGYYHGGEDLGEVRSADGRTVIYSVAAQAGQKIHYGYHTFTLR